MDMILELMNMDLTNVVMKITLYLSLITIAMMLFHGQKLKTIDYLADKTKEHQDTSRQVSTNFHKRFRLISASIVLITSAITIVWFFIRVGELAEQGFAGMFDQLMVQLLWSSSVGDAVMLRIISLAIAFIAIMFMSRQDVTNGKRILLTVSLTLSFITLLASFTFIGHVAELGKLYRLLIILHIGTMAWWFSALIPFYFIIKYMQPRELHKLLVQFGRQAEKWLMLLLVSGFFLSLKLVDDIESLFFTPYGQVLVTKLTVVLLTLIIALFHKVWIVPKLLSKDKRYILKRSLLLECTFAFLILLLAGVLARGQ